MEATAEKKKDAVFSLGVAILAIILSVFAGLFFTYVAQFLWTWFIFPVSGIATPNFWMIYGLILCVRYPFGPMLHKLADIPSKENWIPGSLGSAWQNLIVDFGYAGVFFLTGYLVHLLT